MDASAPNPGGRLAEITARGELRVYSTGDYRPFTYYEPRTSTWSGIDVDMAEDLARRLGVRRAMVAQPGQARWHEFEPVGGLADEPGAEALAPVGLVDVEVADVGPATDAG